MTRTTTATIMIRPAYADDRAALRGSPRSTAPRFPPSRCCWPRSTTSSARPLSLADGSVIADPFFPTLDLVELLRTHAAALTAGHGSWRRHRPVRRLRPHFA